MRDDHDLRYPIGQFEHDGAVTESDLEGWIGDLRALPAALRNAVGTVPDATLNRTYRPGGWTIRQVVHHVPDSHLNAYVRFKWALTEDRPEIKAYDEKGWAELADSRGPIASSLDLLAALHSRWADLIEGVPRGDLDRTFIHPEWGEVRLDRTVGMYAWHGRHHLAHVITALERDER